MNKHHFQVVIRIIVKLPLAGSDQTDAVSGHNNQDTKADKQQNIHPDKLVTRSE